MTHSLPGHHRLRLLPMQAAFIVTLLLHAALLPPPSADAKPSSPPADEYVAAIIELAHEGDAQAQFSLAVMLDQGDRMNRDAGQAFFWFRKAAEQNLPGACLYLGMKYEFGNGVAQNEELAVHWYRKAALQDWPSAQYLLGTFYLKGKDAAGPINGFAWLSLAAEHDYPDAEQARDQAAALLTEAQQKEAAQLLQSLHQIISQNKDPS